MPAQASLSGARDRRTPAARKDEVRASTSGCRGHERRSRGGRARGAFRQDLFFRLNGVRVTLPRSATGGGHPRAVPLPLAQPAGVEEVAACRGGRRTDTLRVRLAGNVRELRHEVARVVALAPDNSSVTAEQFLQASSGRNPPRCAATASAGPRGRGARDHPQGAPRPSRQQGRGRPEPRRYEAHDPALQDAGPPDPPENTKAEVVDAPACQESRKTNSRKDIPHRIASGDTRTAGEAGLAPPGVDFSSTRPAPDSRAGRKGPSCFTSCPGHEAASSVSLSFSP